MAEECLPSLISDTLAITRDLSSTVESIESIEVLSTEDPIIQTPDSIAVKRRAKIKQTLPLIIPNNLPSTDVVDSVLNDRIDITATATTTTESAVSTKSNAIVSFVKLNLAADGEGDLIGKNESPIHQTQNRTVEVISETIFALDSTTVPVTNGDDEEEDDDDVIAEHHRHLLQQRDHEKVGIYLETPVIDESSISIAVNDFEKASGVRPKRLSDDFFSSDDGDDDNKSEPTNASSTLEGETSSTSHLVRLVECEENSHGDMFAVESSFLEEEDTSSSCSNLVNISKAESRFGKRSHQHHHHNDDDIAMGTANSTNDTIGDVVNNADETRNDHVSAYHQTSTDTVVIPFYDNDVQSMDAIERKDFEHEQSLIGGVIIKSSTLVNSDNKLNLEFLESYKQKSKTRSSSENKVSSGSSHIDNFHNHNSSTPTSSRCATARLTKSTAKLNLSASLDRVSDKQSPDENYQKSIEKVRLVNSSNNTSCSTSNKETTTTLASSSSSLSSTSTSSTHHNQPQIQLQNQHTHVNSSSNNNNNNSSSTITTGTGKNVGVDVFLNSNSNDSLSSDKSYNTSSSHSLPNFFSKTNNSELLYRRGELLTASTAVAAAAGTSKCTNTSGDSNFEKTPDLTNNTTTTATTNSYGGSSETGLDTASTSTSSIHSTKCQYANFCCQESLKYPRIITTNSSNSSSEPLSKISMFASSGNTKKIPSTAVRLETSTSSESSKLLRNYDTDTSQPHSSIVSSSSSASTSSTVTATSRLEEHLIEQSQIIVPAEHTEHDFDDDTWADCEEGSDEEVCTCYNEPNEYVQSYIEEELPSRDVDLSGYIQLVTISEDIFLQDHPASDTTTTTITSPTTSTSTTMSQRKRKLNDRLTDSTPDTPSLTYGETTPVGRKRIALDTNRTMTLTPSAGISSPSTFERRTPRSLIPTKDNPPPELSDWLLQFQRWSHAERLLAVDRLIEHCEPTQVRHMMKVIEPQFQRDFISLLPKELALQVLSYLDPKDLLRATQTCRSWRFLCDDNLLWKEKCKQAQIVVEPKTDRPKRGRAGNMPPISSPWKAAYMRQHIIEMNWRSRPIREPKILKGHDDHVITCLQFCGNRIVSGSDDNTLKVWSAISGKCLRTLVGHTGGVWSSQMSGNIIISGSTDRTLKVWNVDTGQCIHTLLGHTSTVRCMHLHGNKVVSGSRDATLRVWDVEQGSCLHVLVGHLAAVRCVQYDGKLIVSGAYDYMVKVWNPERQECLHTLQGHTNRVYSLQFDGIHVVSGSLDTSIRVWDAETGSCKHTLMGHQSLTSGMELRQNILVSGNADSTVKVWDITTGQCLQTLSGPNKHQSAVTCLQFNSRFVITSSDDGTVKLWDVKTGEFIRNLVALDSGGSGGVVWRIRANDTKLICAVGSRNGTEETKLMVLDFDVEGACLKCS